MFPCPSANSPANKAPVCVCLVTQNHSSESCGKQTLSNEEFSGNPKGIREDKKGHERTLRPLAPTATTHIKHSSAPMTLTQNLTLQAFYLSSY